MSTVAVRDTGTALTLQAGQQEFTPAQVATLRQLGVEAAGREDLAIFFHQSVRTGLDPFARQIYMIGRNQKNARTNQWETKYTIQTGIDGYRLIARRAADRARETLGYEDTLWCGEDGQWRDVWLPATPPSAAKATVVRAGQKFTATALWSEYVQTKKDGNVSTMWAKMSSTMLAKCAEALALRKAFPQDLSGIYTMEEMAQADNGPQIVEQPAPEPERPKVTRQRKPVEVATAPDPEPEIIDAEPLPEPPEVITGPQLTKLNIVLQEQGLTEREDKLAYLSSYLERPIASSKDLTKQEAHRLIDEHDAA